MNRLAAATLVLGLAACGGGDDGAAAEAGAEPVVLSATDVAVVREDTLAAGAVVSGTLDPYLEVEVRAQVPGVVTRLRVDRGDAVNRGETLLRIEAEGIRGQAASARAGVAAAEANVALARRQLDSARRLYEAGAMSEIEYEQARAAFEAAQAQRAAAEAQSAGAAESARRATVTAPIAGEVSQRMVSEGEAVNPGAALVTIVNTSRLELAGQVGIEEAARIEPGLPVRFRLQAYPGRVFEGTVARVEPTADPATRQVGVYVQLPNEARSVVGGAYATGRILTGGERTVLLVPMGALRGQNDEWYVWVVQDGVAVRRPVQVGERSEAQGRAEVVSGLEAGETVIVAPGEIEAGTPLRLRDSQPAEIVEEGER